MKHPPKNDPAEELARLRAHVAELERAENALRESEARFRGMFSDAPIGMVVVSRASYVLHANPAFCKFLGYPEQELLDKTVQEITHPDDRDNTSRILAQALEGVPISRFEKRYLRKSGEAVWGEVSVSLVQYADGMPKYTIAQVLDITSRRSTAEALRDSEERYRRLYESMMDAFVSVSMDGRIREFNRVYQTMLGYSDEELKRLTYMELTPTRWHAFEAKIVEEQILPRGYSDVFEKEYRKKDGTVFPVELRTCLTRDAAGQPLAMWAVVRDITGRKRAEEVVRESEERYRALFEDSPVAVWEYDCSRLSEHLNQLKQRGIADVQEHMKAHPEEDGLCWATFIPLDVNRAAVKLTKAEDRSHLLKNTVSIGCDEARDYFRAMIARLATGKTSFEAESALRTLTGEKREVWISSTFIPDRDGLSLKAVIAAADLTELRAAEREVIRQRQAVQLQRMESLAATGRLAAGVAHEINNPLQGIVAQLDLLSEELPAKLRKGKRIKLIRNSVEKIAKIVKDLLRLHQSAQEDETFCAASSVIGSVTDLILPQATSRQVRVEVSITPPDATIPLSTVRLTQVLLNLVLNALDATPSGGIIQIEVTQAPEQTLLLVSDTGSGISLEQRSQIFSPFFTTKGPAGTGLGLPVTHSLVTEAGGTIDVADREGGGTTFFIRFPGGRSHQTDVRYQTR